MSFYGSDTAVVTEACGCLICIYAYYAYIYACVRPYSYAEIIQKPPETFATCY